MTVTTLKRWIKPYYFAAKAEYARRFHSYNCDDLVAAIAAIGISKGDTILMHSGFDRYSGFTGSAKEMIAALIDHLGSHGHLLMMSMPYSGSSERYVMTNPRFDVVKTPSAIGLISETFRRWPTVARSLSPLHPVLAYGPRSRWIVSDHELLSYSCGRGSPFERFLKLDGKLLFYDAPYQAMTFMHYVEDKFRDQHPFEIYEDRPITLEVQNERGEVQSVVQYFFHSRARNTRDFEPIRQALESTGAMRATRVGHSELHAVSASDVVAASAKVISDGSGLYR